MSALGKLALLGIPVAGLAAGLGSAAASTATAQSLVLAAVSSWQHARSLHVDEGRRRLLLPAGGGGAVKATTAVTRSVENPTSHFIIVIVDRLS